MTCYSPLKGWKARHTNQSGKRSIVFNPGAGYSDLPVEIPCGQCIGCRLERSRQWAIRCVHEAQLYEDNCFITLTYNDENYPKNGSLNLAHFQNFMKRFRKSLSHKIRMYHCGEYGDKNARPHYHACIFGHDFTDKILWEERDKIKLYRSEDLERLWPFGFSTIGAVTFESAAYVARYICKKITGDLAQQHYEWIDPSTGEIHQRVPEYTTMSRGGSSPTGENLGGIGSRWFEKFETDVFPSDEVIMRGRSMRPPKYYDGLYEHKNPSELKIIKRQRKKLAAQHPEDQTPERLKVREAVQKSQFKLLPRKV